MQPTSREMQGMTTRTAQISLQDLHNPQIPNFNQPTQTTPPQHDDFIDQMLSNLPPWDLHPPPSQNPNNSTRDLSEDQPPASQQPGNLQYFDESSFLASRLRQHQISSGNSSLQQQLLRAAAPSSGAFAGDSGFFPLPLSLGNGDSSVPPSVDVSSYGLAGSLPRTGQVANHQHFQTPNFVTGSTGMNQVQVPGTTGGGGGGTAPVRQKVRARRGQATDPHSIAERLRRERIAERMKALQELVPNANKTDKASMLDEIIDYVKFLQLQVKVLSMSRLGGAAAVAPLVADISPEGGGDCAQTSGGGRNSNSNGAQTANNDSLTVTEHQVAKLMEEDMGSAMQYLQGKGLCLMPISLASAISTVTCQSRNPPHNTLEGCSSPSLSVISVQSVAMANGGGGEASVKDATSVSKP